MNASFDAIDIEQTYRVPISKLWAAITDATQMRQWFFEPMTEFEPRTGFETQFTVNAEGTDYVHCWSVVEVEPERTISYRWRYEGIPGDSCVTWKLTEADEGATLNLTHRVLEPFPQDNPMFSREAGQAGWEYFLYEQLKEFLEPSNLPDDD